MKTIKNIADDTGVNVQTVYRRLNEIKQNTSEKLTEKIKGVTYFTETGEQLIKESLITVEQQLNDNKHSESGNIAFLTSQIEKLQAEISKEREHSRQQADKIASLAEQLAKLTENGQILLREQNLKRLPEKTSFWDRFKRKKGGHE